MFKLLKDRLNGFFGKPEEEKKTKVKTKKQKEIKTKTKEIKSKSSKKTKIPSDKELKKQAKEIKEELPTKFSNASLQYRPDTEAIKEESKNQDNAISKEKKSFFSKLFSSEEKAEHEKVIEEPKKSLQPKKQQTIPEIKPSFLSKFVSKLSTTTLKQEHIDEIFEPLELILLENNVALDVVDRIRANLEKDLIGIEVKKDKIESTILESLKSSISKILIEPPNLLDLIKQKNKTGDIYTIVFFGINGSGKTTSIAKLAYKLKKAEIKTVLAASDTFRAASIEQLKAHASRIDVPIIAHDYGSDPAAIAFDTKTYAEKHKLNVVLVDTAGRMYTKANLMKEIEKIIRISKPDLKIFVAESITGNDAVQQAKMFDEAVGIDGIILTKADIDEKGGAILSISYTTGKPIYFMGTGQSYDDLEDFRKEDVLRKLGLD